MKVNHLNFCCLICACHLTLCETHPTGQRMMRWNFLQKTSSPSHACMHDQASSYSLFVQSQIHETTAQSCVWWDAAFTGVSSESYRWWRSDQSIGSQEVSDHLDALHDQKISMICEADNFCKWCCLDSALQPWQFCKQLCLDLLFPMGFT